MEELCKYSEQTPSKTQVCLLAHRITNLYHTAIQAYAMEFVCARNGP